MAMPEAASPRLARYLWPAMFLPRPLNYYRRRDWLSERYAARQAYIAEIAPADADLIVAEPGKKGAAGMREWRFRSRRDGPRQDCKPRRRS